MVDPLDFEIGLDKYGAAVIRYVDGKQAPLEIDIIDLIQSAADWLTADEMNKLYEKLDAATSLTRRLSREIRTAQTTD